MSIIRRVTDIGAVSSVSKFRKLSSAIIPTISQTDSGFNYTKEQVLTALSNRDPYELYQISNYFYGVSGLYKRLVFYFASMLTYDHLVIPHIQGKVSENVFMKDYEDLMDYIDSLGLKTTLGNITLKVIKDGAYYGYTRDLANNSTMVQDLPNRYCRSLYKVMNRYAVEFDVRYFTNSFRIAEDRKNELDRYPREFKKKYEAYISGKDKNPWFLLDMNYAVCFKLDAQGLPFFIGSIPELIELKEAKQIDKNKSRQDLYKLLIQSLPLDKNNELVFDMDEMNEIHNNATKMVSTTPGVNVLTSPAKIDVANLQDTRAVNGDSVGKVERGVFVEAGVSPMIFATDGNIALAQSILNDASILLNTLLPQFEAWLNEIIGAFSPNKKYSFSIWLPPLTHYNREAEYGRYKEMASLGYSKTVVAMTIGMKQKDFLHLLSFENDILKLNDKMIPLSTSYTTPSDSSNGAGAPTKTQDQKSDKTLANEASQN